jgi:hypothetical protein
MQNFYRGEGRSEHFTKESSQLFLTQSTQVLHVLQIAQLARHFDFPHSDNAPKHPEHFSESTNFFFIQSVTHEMSPQQLLPHDSNVFFDSSIFFFQIVLSVSLHETFKTEALDFITSMK